MSGLVVRQAKRDSAKPLLAFYAESGGGKTRAALTLARGFVGPSGKVGMVETENGRGEVYADAEWMPGGYEVISLRPEDGFSPRRYSEAITAAERAGWQAMIIDSASHEWEGIGGVLDMAEQKKAAGAKGMQVWTQCKIDHQKYFMGRLLQTSIPLVILCLRAKYPMEETVNPDTGKKEMTRCKSLEPKQSADIMYDVFVHGWFDKETHSFHATNYLRDELAQVIPSGKQITLATGKALADWSAGIYGAQPSPALTAVLGDIEAAPDMAALEALAPRCAALSDAEKKRAKEAYARKGGALKAEAKG